jgi:hypothetical protein
VAVTYAKRENAFEKGEHVWRVEEDCLIWTRPAGDSLTLLWKDVGAVRTAFAPTEWKTWRHVFELTTRKGATLVVDNAHFKSVGDFEDRSASFIPFVLACVDRIAVLAPDARGRVGAGPLNYYGQLAFALGMMVLLAFVLFTLPTPTTALIVIKLALIGAMLPVAIAWAVRSKPRKVPLRRESFLPGLPEPPLTPRKP